MSAEPITLHLDKSADWRIHLERDGQAVTVEDALRDGFTVTANDAPALLTMVKQFLHVREHQSL